MEWDSDSNDSNSSSDNGVKSPKEGVSLVSVDELTASFSKMHGVCQTRNFRNLITGSHIDERIISSIARGLVLPMICRVLPYRFLARVRIRIKMATQKSSGYHFLLHLKEL